jgi:FAD/FMN-containing dehydrogenase
VRRTLPLGLIPKVVPELEGITLGGAVAGCSVESMSYRYGGFHDGCREYEVVSGAGEVLTLGPDREPDLFHRVHGSYGTLGILSKLRFDLVPAKPYVRMEYRRLPSQERFHEAMLRACRDAEADFIDAIVHGPDAFVLCLGRFADSAPRVSDYRRAGVFYKSTARLAEDWLRTEDYCFRYDADCHWLSRTFPPLEWKAVRLLAGRYFLGSTNLIQWTNRLGPLLARLMKRPDVVVDVFIPSRNFPPFWDWYARTFRYYPLWVIPYRMPEPYPWLAPAFAARMRDDLFYDCAVYGKRNVEPHVDYSALLEEKTYELDGIKTLISRNHYDRERFNAIYDEVGYRSAKARLDPQGVFPGVYEKLHRVE